MKTWILGMLIALGLLAGLGPASADTQPAPPVGSSNYSAVAEDFILNVRLDAAAVKKYLTTAINPKLRAAGQKPLEPLLTKDGHGQGLVVFLDWILRDETGALIGPGTGWEQTSFLVVLVKDPRADIRLNPMQQGLVIVASWGNNQAYRDWFADEGLMARRPAAKVSRRIGVAENSVSTSWHVSDTRGEIEFKAAFVVDQQVKADPAVVKVADQAYVGTGGVIVRFSFDPARPFLFLSNEAVVGWGGSGEPPLPDPHLAFTLDIELTDPVPAALLSRFRWRPYRILALEELTP
jgi:hypothetical protein